MSPDTAQRGQPGPRRGPERPRNSRGCPARRCCPCARRRPHRLSLHQDHPRPHPGHPPWRERDLGDPVPDVISCTSVNHRTDRQGRGTPHGGELRDKERKEATAMCRGSGASPGGGARVRLVRAPPDAEPRAPEPRRGLLPRVDGEGGGAGTQQRSATDLGGLGANGSAVGLSGDKTSYTVPEASRVGGTSRLPDTVGGAVVSSPPPTAMALVQIQGAGPSRSGSRECQSASPRDGGRWR